MEIKTSYSYGAVPVCIVRLRGEINTRTADGITERVQAEFDQGAKDVLLDLSGVSYSNSAGVRLIYWMNNYLHPQLEGAEREARAEEIREGTYRAPHLKILSPTKFMLKVLHMVGVDMYFEIYTDEDEAVSSFGNQGSAPRPPA